MVRVGRLIEAAHAPAQACFGVTFRRIAGLASRQSRPWPTPHPALSCVCVDGGCGLARGSTQSEQLAVFTRSRCRGASDSTKSGSARAPSAHQACGAAASLWAVGCGPRCSADGCCGQAHAAQARGLAQAHKHATGKFTITIYRVPSLRFVSGQLSSVLRAAGGKVDVIVL